ncbi:MAG: ATP-binding cassette domain-containing protein, partial [Betaproteobacteria bacterium]
MGAQTIRLLGVEKHFARAGKRTHALTDINLTIDAGEFVAVVGPSGCGKSTLLRLVAGLMPASAGTVHYDDELVSEPRKNTGIVFQKANLVQWRNAIDNVLLQIDLRSLDVSEYRARAESLLSSLGLSDFLDRYPHELSGGMQQRASIA